MEDDLAPLQRDVQQAHTLSNAHAARLDALENRLQRNNGWAVGVPERAEGKNPVTCIENWLINIFDRDSFSPCLWWNGPT